MSKRALVLTLIGVCIFSFAFGFVLANGMFESQRQYDSYMQSYDEALYTRLLVQSVVSQYTFDQSEVALKMAENEVEQAEEERDAYGEALKSVLSKMSPAERKKFVHDNIYKWNSKILICGGESDE